MRSNEAISERSQNGYAKASSVCPLPPQAPPAQSPGLVLQNLKCWDSLGLFPELLPHASSLVVPGPSI